jgi:hypothetical protein
MERRVSFITSLYDLARTVTIRYARRKLTEQEALTCIYTKMMDAGDPTSHNPGK